MHNPALLVAGTVLLAGFFDCLLGELPTAIHPVGWIGKFISFFESRMPARHPALQFAWGVFTVLATCSLAGGIAWGLTIGLNRLAWWIALPVEAYLLKTMFSLRGLIQAAHTVRRSLETNTDAAREELRSMVSRSRDLDPPQIVSATIESVAENLTDSVMAPILAFALFGLPGAAVYRAVNTMDAMIGYRGKFEYFGKCAARLDDVLNWIPARIAGLLLCMVALMATRQGHAFTTLRRDRHVVESPNAAWTMAPMAGALRVQLEKVGHYRLGLPERPLIVERIGEATRLCWAAGGLYLILGTGLAALITKWNQ